MGVDRPGQGEDEAGKLFLRRGDGRVDLVLAAGLAEGSM